MRRPRSIGLLAVLSALLMLASGALPATAATSYFGATLDKFSQPSNAEGGQRCDKNAGIPSNATCTWVATSAYHNGPTGNKAIAPKSGTIGQIRLISCVKGSFTLQIVRKQSNGAFKVVRSGPTINYAADPDCGNDDGTYKVQKFSTSFSIQKGSYIAFKAKKTGTLYCSGDNGVELIAPALGLNQQSKPDADTSCNMLVALYYS